MQGHDLLAQQGSVGHGQAVIHSANEALTQPLDHQPMSAAVMEWSSDKVTVSLCRFPRSGVLLTVKPRCGPVSLVREASVLLYPDDATLPVRFGVLSRLGQLSVTELDEATYWIKLHAPWWLDDGICAAVRAGELKWAFIDTPVILPRAIEAREEPTQTVMAAGTRLRMRAAGEPPVRYLSADKSLGYTIAKNGTLLVRARLHRQSGGGATVCLGEVRSTNTSMRTTELLSSRFTPEAASMRCARLMMLGTGVQQPPPTPWTISLKLDERLDEGLTSHVARYRWAAAMELQAHLHALCAQPGITRSCE
jgi:hypothetical protein